MANADHRWAPRVPTVEEEKRIAENKEFVGQWEEFFKYE
jgi:hypothetical protein